VPNHFCVSKTHKRLTEEVFNEVFRFILCDRASRQCSRPQTIIDAAVNAEQAGVENELQECRSRWIDPEESVTSRWQLEPSRHHALDGEILVERLPTQRCATDLQPNLGQLGFTGISQTAEPIRRESHDPLVRQLDKDHPPLSPRSRRYGFGFLVGDAHRISPTRDRRVQSQSLHFPHNMKGNAAVPTKAHWIEPEFAFTLRTPNVDVRRLYALVGVKVKPKSAYSEYRWHPFKVLPLGHAGKFCSGRGGDVIASSVRQRSLPRPASPCHVCPTSLLRHFSAES
jgi:hypothetical protein